MKIAIFDQSPATLKYLQAKHSSFGEFERIIINPKDRLIDIAAKIELGTNKAIFINIEGTWEGTERKNLKGIELIFWLRLKYNYPGPIVTYGFLSSGEVLRLQPKAVVIHAPGNFHWRLTDTLDTNDIPLPVKEGKVESHYAPFVQKFIDIEAVRHREANWWGISSLWNCHQIITRGEFRTHLPREIEKKLAGIDSFLLKKKYSVPEELFQPKINNVKGEQSKDILVKTIQSIREEFGIPTSTAPIGKKGLEKKEAEYKKLLKSFRLKDILNKKKQGEIQKLHFEIEELKNLAIAKGKKPKYYKPPKILLIDDQAMEGWAIIYQYILFGKKDKNNFSVLEFSHSSPLSEVIKKATDKVEPYDIIFLDLRLFPDKDNLATDIGEVSGFKLLQELVKKFPEKRILVTSASNKIWAYREVLATGADAFWIKEGVDNILQADSQLLNYKKLLDYVRVLSNSEYLFLQEIWKKTKGLEAREKFWWGKKKWGIVNKGRKTLPHSTETDRELIFKILKESLLFYRSYLCDFFLHKSINRESSWFYYSSIIVHLSKSIEKIHRIDNQKYKAWGGVKNILQARNDKKAMALWEARNNCAHFYGSRNINFIGFKKFVLKMFSYISNDSDN